ncbi:MAG: hypothetical protein AAF213_11820, partial [Pseudomonadota bacterium]
MGLVLISVSLLYGIPLGISSGDHNLDGLLALNTGLLALASLALRPLSVLRGFQNPAQHDVDLSA